MTLFLGIAEIFAIYILSPARMRIRHKILVVIIAAYAFMLIRINTRVFPSKFHYWESLLIPLSRFWPRKSLANGMTNGKNKANFEVAYRSEECVQVNALGD
jgi:hypothetical protein